MRLNVFNSLIGLCVATAAVSCSDGLVEDNLRPVGGEASDMISFVVANENNATRGGSYGNRPCGGAILRSTDGADSLFLNMSVADITDDLMTRAESISDATEITNLYMTCLIRTGDAKTKYTNYFEDVAFVKKNDESVSYWASEPAYYWLNSGEHFNFYGYFASDKAKNNGWVKFNNNSTLDSNDPDYYIPSIEYTVPSAVNNQFDLVYHKNANDGSEYISTGYNQRVGLNIKHALSKISFQAGTQMADGVISSISITNARNKGTLNLGSGDWNISKDSADDFKIDFGETGVRTEYGKESPSSITGDNFFMLLPQDFDDASTAEILVEFTPDGGEKDTYAAPLKNLAWAAGKSYTYTITIDPEYGIEIEIDEKSKIVDAHYVIAKAHVKVPEDQPNMKWELEVSADDSSEVTVVNNLNDYNKDGYWTDKIFTREYDKDGKEIKSTEESARGYSSLNGTGNQFVYIFVPENAGETIRTITLQVKLKDGTSIVAEETFNQNCPDWSGGSYGWENKEEYTEWADDNQGGLSQKEGKPAAPWGFNWTRKVSYQSQTIWGNAWVNSPAVKDLVTQYKADNYAKVTNTDILEKVKIELNYSNIGSFNGITFNDNNGLKNSQNLYNNIGLTSTNIKGLETALLELQGVDWVSTGWGLFDGYFQSIQLMKQVSASGEINEDLVAFGYILKKNRFIINKNIRHDENNDQETEGVSFENGEKDIVWYMPAKGQFSSGISKEGADAFEDTYWSSNPDVNNQAFTSITGESRGRSTLLKVRACRNKPPK